MSRVQKEHEVEGYKQNFAGNEIFVIAQYSGLTVAEMTELRIKIRETGAKFKVAKNKLAKRALEGTQIAGLSGMLVGPVGIASSQDPAVAKAIYEFAKTHKKLVIIGGAMGAQILDSAAVEQLAKLPSLDELRGTLIGLIQAPAQKIVGVVSAPAAQLARVVSAYATKGQ
ncbi:MAG: 50S ribosomal protein L10 [Alphaproteobacteria bacterium CG_4_9_14_3_um_filter_47_13]|nr:MAG: 50S ribosomal protein L10 [Alphaproteobacteria bacterium CG_4_9_14_3_um_filter_47_13]